MKSKQTGCGGEADLGGSYRPFGGVTARFWTEEKCNLISVLNPQEMVYKRYFKACTQNEKNFPLITLMPYL